MVQVEIVLGDVVPRKVQEGFEVVRLHTVFACLRIHAFKLPNFLVEGLSGMFRPVFACGFRALFQNLLLQRIGPQFLLNGLHLLMQEKFPLLLVQIGLDFPLDVLLEGQHLLFLVEQFEHFLCAIIQVDFLENALFVLDLNLHVAPNEIDQKAQPVDALDGFSSFRRDVGVHFNQLHRQVA